MYKTWIRYIYIYLEDRFNNSSSIFCSITPLFLSPVAGVTGIRAPEVFWTLKRTESEKDRVSEDMRVTLGEETLRFSCRTSPWAPGLIYTQAFETISSYWIPLHCSSPPFWILNNNWHIQSALTCSAVSNHRCLYCLMG